MSGVQEREGGEDMIKFPKIIKVHFLFNCQGNELTDLVIFCSKNCGLCSGRTSFNHPHSEAVEYELVKKP